MIVYTAITGDKNHLRDDIICFGDEGKFKRPVMEAKRYKILSHQFIDTDISIWVDGNIFLLVPCIQLVDDFLGDADMAVFKHPWRDCLFWELQSIIGLDGDKPLGAREQVEHYRKMGHPKHWGLGECGMIIRRHNDKIIKFNNEWWSEICRWSARDQLSFPYVLRQNPDIKCNFIVGNVREHPYFKYEDHKLPHSC
jgi:hypothetical protein